ncbi:MAG: MBL fold metallo-hydrolase [Deltaproteobacteria bacterium]|jgi:beta-lactamase superfamily II metal-dependent hydrolase|nr:MBL fold metallo-hydrolase [Deltaproteobacteria bacterium]
MKSILLLAGVLFTTSCSTTQEFDRKILDRVHDNEVTPTTPEEGKENQKLKITFLNVGQGDATLIMAPNNEIILFDGGPPGAGADTIIPYLQSNNIDQLTHIIATHYHADHIGGIPEIIAGPDGQLDTYDDLIPTGFVYDRGEDQTALEQAYYPPYADATDTFHAILNPGDRIVSEDLSFEILAVDGELIDGTIIDMGDPRNENSASIATLIEYRTFTLFIGGDLTGGGIDSPDVESTLAPLVGDIDILRVSHHGSRTSTNQTFLDHTKPEAAIISYGEENDHGHPHDEVVKRLIDNGIEIHETNDGNVTIEIDSDGKHSFSQ